MKKNIEKNTTPVVDSVKISELQETLFLNENDVIPVVQNGETKKIKSKVLHGLKTRVVDNLTVGGKDYALSAEQGKLIGGRLKTIEDTVPVWQNHSGEGSVTIHDGFEETLKDVVITGKTVGGWNEATASFDTIVSSAEGENNVLKIRTVGKNLFSGVYFYKMINENTGVISNAVGGNVASDYIKISGFKTLTYNTFANTNYLKIALYDLNKKFIKCKTDGRAVKTLTENEIPANAEYAVIGCNYMDGKPSDLSSLKGQLEEGTIATDYVPYVEQKAEVQLPCSHLEGNIYNGEIGKYTVNRYQYKFTGNENFQLGGAYSTYLECILDVSCKANTSIICNTLKQVQIGATLENNPSGIAGLLGGKFRIKPFEKNNMTLQEGIEWLQANPTTVIYELATPIEHNIEKLPPLKQYKGTTHLMIDNEIKGNISCKAKVSLSAQNNRLRDDNENLRKDLNTRSEHFNEKDISLTSNSLELDFRLMEVEFALDVPINLKKEGGITMAATPYEMMKTVILGGKYDRADYEYKISIYVKRGRMTQAEADELIALMDAKEITQ